MTSSAITTATDADYAEKIVTGKPTLVDFWATWCGPCKQISPILDEIAEQHPEYAVIKVDIAEAPEAVKALGITGVPYIAIMDGNGQVVSDVRGARPKQVLLDALNAI